jgi:hypothetical protein
MVVLEIIVVASEYIKLDSEIIIVVEETEWGLLSVEIISVGLVPEQSSLQ